MAQSQAGGSAEPWLKVIGSRHLMDWLAAEQVSLGFTTYQFGKLLLLGQKSRHELAVFERSFERCMGLCASADAQTLWMSSRSQLWRFENMPADGPYDRLYVPRTSHVTGDIDIHDLAIDGGDRPVFVNTLFNCLATVSPRFNFECLWRPDFISRLAAEDRCHLNGLAMRDGKPRYVTLCARSDVVDGWRDHRADGGCVIDVTSNEVLVEGLSMPHSPRWHQDRLWLLEAGSGWFGFIDPHSGRFERVTFCSGYARGLAIFGDWAVVGLSLPRHEPTFQGLPLDEELKRRGAVARCGLQVIHLKSGDVAHWVRIENKVHELYEVVALQGVSRPAALGFMTDEIEQNVWFTEGEQTHRWTAAGRSDDQPARPRPQSCDSETPSD
ncbi:MAG: TIGR03032 family protein [Planctomycetes bacterium]|nr:TIGR03032 family protein [Planctomycetota bacterium]